MLLDGITAREYERCGLGCQRIQSEMKTEVVAFYRVVRDPEQKPCKQIEVIFVIFILVCKHHRKNCIISCTVFDIFLPLKCIEIDQNLEIQGNVFK